MSEEINFEDFKRGDLRAPPRRLLAESAALSLIDHHVICRIYDVIPMGAEAYCEILEWIDGENIKSFCDRLRMPIKERVQLLLPVLDAIGHVHDAGFLHSRQPSRALLRNGICRAAG